MYRTMEKSPKGGLMETAINIGCLTLGFIGGYALACLMCNNTVVDALLKSCKLDTCKKREM